MRVLLGLGLAGSSLLLSGATWGSPADIFGFGARGRALAGAGAAVSEGYGATYGNPARLSNTKSQQIALGFQAEQFDLFATSSAGGTVTALDDSTPSHAIGSEQTQAAVLGLVLPLELGGALRHRLGLGLGVSTPGTTMVRVRILDPAKQQFPLLVPRADSLNFNVGLGARLPWGLSAGVGVLLIGSLVGEIDIQAGGSGTVSSVTDDELIVAAAPVVGLTWQWTRHAWLGAVWRSELRSEFDLQVQIRDLGSVVVPPLNVTGLAQADPAQLQLEVAHQRGDWLLAMGASYQLWSRFDRLKQSTVTCPAEQPDCAAPPVATVEFSDTLVPRVALERRVALTKTASSWLRAGYAFAASPLAPQSGATNLFDNDRHLLSAGYGVELKQPWPLSVNLAAQRHWLAARTHLKRDSPSVETSGSITTVALDVEVTF